ncbi:MAG: actin-binding protein [Bdellovibrio sp.]|nr:actin-binding protein [Bdellovibrio sp.]
MALTKFQSFVKKISESQNVKKVIADLQTLSTDVQKVVKQVNTDDAVKKYKEIMKKVSKREAELEKEVKKMTVKFKKSASEAEKNLMVYKKKALEQKAKIEKMFKGKTSAKAAAPKAASNAKKTVKKTAKKAAPKRTTRKA